jgi:hypothetical protein
LSFYQVNIPASQKLRINLGACPDISPIHLQYWIPACYGNRVLHRANLGNNLLPEEKTMKRILALGLTAVALALMQTQVMSHHAFSSEFDQNKPIRVQGKITRMEWINPHTWLHMEAVLDDGSIQEWMMEGGTPNTLLRQGLTSQILQIGSEIIVRGYQSKDPDCIPKCRGSGRDITFADGRNIFMGSTGVGAPTEDFPADDDL